MTRPRGCTLLLLAGLLLITGCSGEAKEVGQTIAEPTPDPSPSPTLRPVQGAVDVATMVSGRPDLLGFTEHPPPDPDAVRERAAAVSAALDRFLDGAQRGDPDLLVLRGAWLENVDPAAAEILRTKLTNRDNPVLAASYSLTVHVEPEPVIAAVRATIQRDDGTTVGLDLVFDVTAEQPRLQLVGNAKAA